MLYKSPVTQNREGEPASFDLKQATTNRQLLTAAASITFADGQKITGGIDFRTDVGLIENHGGMGVGPSLEWVGPNGTVSGKFATGAIINQE